MQSVAGALAEYVVTIGIRRRWWLPLDQRLWIEIVDSTDDALVGVTFSGVVRGYDLTERGVLTRLLVELEQPYRTPRIDKGRPSESVEWLVTVPDLHSRTSTLCFGGSVAVRLVEASSFVDCLHVEPIGTARLRLWD